MAYYTPEERGWRIEDGNGCHPLSSIFYPPDAGYDKIVPMRTPLVLILLLFSAQCYGSEAGWSQYGIIDIHAHIGTFRGYDLGLETLLESLRRYGVHMALISNIDSANAALLTKNLTETVSNRATEQAVRQYPELLRGLIWAKPESGSPSEVEPFLSHKLENGSPVFVGIKFHPEFNHFSADDPRVDGYLKLCEKYGISAVFHCGHPGTNSGVEKIYAAARRHPSVSVILYHMGFFGPYEPAITAAKKARANRDALLYLETAQADPDSVIHAIRELGSSYLLFGTDATYYGRDHYAKYQKLIDRLKRDLAPGDFDKVVRGNAEALFHLK